MMQPEPDIVFNQGTEDEYVQKEKNAPTTFKEVWDLNSDKIFYGLKPNNNYKLREHEELHISYGERTNAYLLVEYGFALPNNPYDFFRVNNVTLQTFGLQPCAVFESRLKQLNLKETIRADLKDMGLHRDVLKLLRSNFTEPTDSETTNESCV